MPSDASQRLAMIARELRVAGERDVRLGMTRAMRAAAAPVRDEVRAAALRQLPKRGGLAAAQANSVRVSVLTGARTAGVYVRDTRVSSFQTDQGYVRHPVFGDKKDWRQEELPQAAGWWTKTLSETSSRTVEVAIVAEMDRVVARIGAL